MLSRIADSLFWMNRYMERADGLLRTLRTGYIASFDASKEKPFDWDEKLDVFAAATEGRPNPSTTSMDGILKYMLFDVQEHNSLKVMATRARENARGAQDHITKEVWESINQIYHRINDNDAAAMMLDGGQVPLLDLLTEDSLVYYGVTDITMPRSMGWHFMNLGRYMERCLQTLGLMDARFTRMEYDITSTHHILYWRNLLLCLSGYEMYLKSYRTGNPTENIINMVFFNTQFPRSIFYSVKRIGHYLEKILDENKEVQADEMKRKMGKLYATIAYSSLEDIKEQGLKEFMQAIEQQVTDLQQLVGQSFFSYY
jgi:uncharacterized alpha-E superfamily protein